MLKCFYLIATLIFDLRFDLLIVLSLGLLGARTLLKELEMSN